MPDPQNPAVLLIGGGGHARSLADVLARGHRPIAAVVDPALSPTLGPTVNLATKPATEAASEAAVDPDSGQAQAWWQGPTGEQIPLLASTQEIESWGTDMTLSHFCVAIGNNAVRQREFDRCLAQGLTPAKVIASTATVCGVVGEGGQVLEHAHVGPGARLGRNVIVNTAAVVEHDVQIGDHVHIAPGARLLAGVTVGSGALIGAGAVVLPFVSVAAAATVGAGSIVAKDVPAGVVVVGNPARPL